jgi:FdhE protein
MQRILAPGQIEAFSQRDIQRLRLPDRARIFSTRAARLRQQSETGAIGYSVGDYLKLMAHLADAQQVALANIEPVLPDAEQITHAQTYYMPIVSVRSWRRDERWRRSPPSICDALAALPDLSTRVRSVCDRLRALQPEQLEAQAEDLLAARGSAIDASSAPFVMAALQVYWVALASRMNVADIHDLGVPGVCPMCGTLPVASVVRSDSRSQGLRYLHCGLCATEWHLVRVTCSNCQNTKGISYRSIENGPAGIRAECCDTCHTYRKILYQEEDTGVEPVADDLASLTLDLLLGEAGYQRASPNPLLWNPP